MRPAPQFYENPVRIILVICFTFKYLPNIIQKFYTHVAVRDMFALTTQVSHVRNLLCRHLHMRP